MNNKTAKNLINEVFEIHGKKTNDINLLYKLRNNIVSITPKISNQEIKRALVKSRAHLTGKIRRTKNACFCGGKRRPSSKFSSKVC